LQNKECHGTIYNFWKVLFLTSSFFYYYLFIFSMRKILSYDQLNFIILPWKLQGGERQREKGTL